MKTSADRHRRRRRDISHGNARQSRAHNYIDVVQRGDLYYTWNALEQMRKVLKADTRPSDELRLEELGRRR